LRTPSATSRPDYSTSDTGMPGGDGWGRDKQPTDLSPRRLRETIPACSEAVSIDIPIISSSNETALSPIVAILCRGKYPWFCESRASAKATAPATITNPDTTASNSIPRAIRAAARSRVDRARRGDPAFVAAIEKALMRRPFLAREGARLRKRVERRTCFCSTAPQGDPVEVF
jgi:hypothetical protein